MKTAKFITALGLAASICCSGQPANVDAKVSSKLEQAATSFDVRRLVADYFDELK